MLLPSCKRARIFNEFPSKNQNFWFDIKENKFLHNIDTFYYSVFINRDFSRESSDMEVLKFREYFSLEFSKIADFDDSYCPELFPKHLVLKRSGFAGMYNIHISRPDYYDFFIAGTVPNNKTSQVVVQIRSYYLWLHGMHKAFEDSFIDVCGILGLFGFDVSSVQENRVDYCWHTNYIQNPAQFLTPENVSKMRVSSLGHDGDIHLEFVGDSDYEIDYFRFGRLKSNNCIFRIYLKSKEVVEMGYKGFFLKLWLLNGLINRYDLYVYEECYKRGDWGFLNKARLMFYSEHGEDRFFRERCALVLDDKLVLDADKLGKLADELTPKVTLILNLEYQTMRKFSASINCVSFRPHSGPARRVYDYLDNRKLIIEYLTHTVFRMVKPSGNDMQKCRWDYTAFWDRLRHTRLVDTYVKVHNLKLVREYSNKLDREIIKNRVINGVVTNSLYRFGVDSDTSIADDFIDFLCTLNDNDMERAGDYKAKKRRLLRSRLSGVGAVPLNNRFCLIDKDTGELI